MTGERKYEKSKENEEGKKLNKMVGRIGKKEKR